MRRLESIEDQMRGVVTYELPNGRRVRMSAGVGREYGAAKILRRMGHGDLLPTQRVTVMQHGKKIGTLPPDFDPMFVKSKNYFYDPRPGDFVREGDAWVASRMLGPGDLEAVPGFVWNRN